MNAPNYRSLDGETGDHRSPARLLVKATWQSHEPMTLRDLYHELLSTGISAHELMVSPGVFVHWYVRESDEAYAARQRRIGAEAARTEQWERETLARLKAKYEGDK